MTEDIHHPSEFKLDLESELRFEVESKNEKVTLEVRIFCANFRIT